jgi:hypothetical protein
MNAVKAVLAELFGLFVDDGGLALGVLAVVAAAGALGLVQPDLSLDANAVLLFGCVAVLIATLVRSARP